MHKAVYSKMGQCWAVILEDGYIVPGGWNLTERQSDILAKFYNEGMESLEEEEYLLIQTTLQQ